MNGNEAMRDWYKKRIAELEAENGALKKRIKWWYAPCPNCGAFLGMGLTSKGGDGLLRVWCCYCEHFGPGAPGPVGEKQDREAIRLWNAQSAARQAENKGRIAELEAENAALREQWENAMRAAKEEAGHEIGLWPPGAVAAIYSLRADKERLVAALEEIAEGDGCNCRVGPGCDWKCKDIAHSALRAARKEEPHA